MAKKPNANRAPVVNEADKPPRTRTMPEFTLIADAIDGGEREVLCRVKGSTAAKAVFAFAKKYLDDKYQNFRHVKESTVTFDGELNLG